MRHETCFSGGGRGFVKSPSTEDWRFEGLAALTTDSVLVVLSTALSSALTSDAFAVLVLFRS